MSPFRCIIVDDQEFAIKHLVDLFRSVPQLSVIATYTDPVEALNDVNLKRVQPDIIFLDVEMQALPGIQFANLVQITSIAIVFCTGYPAFGSASYETEAVDFLLKPVSFERLQRTLHRVTKTRETAPVKPRTSFFIEADKGRFDLINYQDVLYLKAEGNYVAIYSTGKKNMAYVTLTEAEEFLKEPQFFRVHRSFIVNMDQIVAVDSESVWFAANQQVPIGSSYRQHFMDMLTLLRKKR